jgi:hypothetical protein
MGWIRKEGITMIRSRIKVGKKLTGKLSHIHEYYWAPGGDMYCESQLTLYVTSAISWRPGLTPPLQNEPIGPGASSNATRANSFKPKAQKYQLFAYIMPCASLF